MIDAQVIASFVKEAGLITDIGMKIMPKLKAIPTALAGSINNAGDTVKAFSTPVTSLKNGLRASTIDFNKMPTWQKGLMGVGLAASAHEVAAKEDPLREGRGRIERGFTAVGDQLGGLVGTPFGLTGGVVGSQIGRQAGKVVGKGAEALKRSLKKRKPSSQPFQSPSEMNTEGFRNVE